MKVMSTTTSVMDIHASQTLLNLVVHSCLYTSLVISLELLNSFCPQHHNKSPHSLSNLIPLSNLCILLYNYPAIYTESLSPMRNVLYSYSYSLSNLYIVSLIYTFDRMISGAKYSGVPHSVHVRPLTFLAKPKSVTLT